MTPLSGFWRIVGACPARPAHPLREVRAASFAAPVSVLVLCMLAVCLLGPLEAGAEDFEVIEVSPRIILVKEPALGQQVAIATQKGIVVFDTFRGEPTAARFKQEIARALSRNDFAYVVNVIDRLDLIGGNAAYEDAEIISQKNLLTKYEGRDEAIAAEVQELIEMWRWKEDVMRERLATLDEGSEEYISGKEWMITCGQRAEELESGFSLVLPQRVYDDRMTLDMGDITLELIWFGHEGSYNAITMVVVPEEGIAITNTSVMSYLHLAPHPFHDHADMDVPRWIAVLEEVLEGEDAVDMLVSSDVGEPLPRERALEHLEYIRRLWESVTEAEAAGLGLSEVQERLSLDAEFSFVKEMAVYLEAGDDWLRPQHHDHVRLFYLQHKDLIASKIIMDGGAEGLDASLARVRDLRAEGSDIYIEEGAVNGIGYYFLNEENVPEAIEVFKFNVEVFPASANVYDSLGEAYMRNGDKADAIANYKRSLELNPDNTNAVEMLKELERM